MHISQALPTQERHVTGFIHWKPGAFYPTHQDATLVKTCCGFQKGFCEQKGLSVKTETHHSFKPRFTLRVFYFVLFYFFTILHADFKGLICGIVQNEFKYVIYLAAESIIKLARKYTRVGRSRILQMTGLPIPQKKKIKTCAKILKTHSLYSCWLHMLLKNISTICNKVSV